MKIEKKDIKPVCLHCEARVERLILVKHGLLADYRQSRSWMRSARVWKSLTPCIS